MLVRGRMTTEVVTVTPETTIAEALRITRGNRIRHLPVVEDGRLAGVVSDRDLRLALPPIWAAEHAALQQALEERTVAEVMTPEVIAVAPDTVIEEAGKLMAANHIGCLPVLDGDTLVGIITETDVLLAFVQVFGADRPSSRVEVRMRNRPGELARVVRVVGIDHAVNISGLVVPPADDAPESVAIMHLQTLDPRSIVLALRRLGYTVGWPAVELDDPSVYEEQEAARRRDVPYVEL